ncbi:ABC transporter ATP-binding protein [Crateriforma conspicua]|uniref:Bicarbonate transport ATP-binding protein CmpC n=1 Tax=Crateriforma conspicua TaxID=2527996 RepID=A0A5C5Y7J9_9PLAN|nr:ABC transporter ATP-binding protein [Crateriforma conspicua]QDV64878.1 Bicarbonate transport ATP-binding protein CmpC [Crateriforma conspicua]TWT70275.1 Bicarbonate transport ATP-binding protein CmpC [Crateriforma conspicua]
MPAAPLNAAEPTACASAVRCRRLSVEFPGAGRQIVKVINQADVEFASGEISALIGPSGCGKTTLLRTIAGLQSPSSGGVTIDPPSVGRRGELGFVFQHPALLPWRTTLQNVSLPLRLTRSCDPADATRRATEILDTVGMADAIDRFPHQLSGGMQMRVSIARALVTRPRLLLLDEPFAALDDILRGQLWELLLGLWRQLCFTAILVTHNIAEACLLSHRIFVMRDGTCGDGIINPLSWPRSQQQRRTPEFGQFYGTISDRLRTSVGVQDHGARSSQMEAGT